jgi:predicted Zn-dependent protease
MHELGHGMGLLGHSDESGDLMYPMEFVPGSKISTKAVSIGARDINTLKKVYELPGIESGYSAPAPMEWGMQWSDH